MSLGPRQVGIVEVEPPPSAASDVDVPPVESGDRLRADEFVRRYERMPRHVKAELIGGTVHVASPVRVDFHGHPLLVFSHWLGQYTFAVPGTFGGVDSTTRLADDSVPQPDLLLTILPECGGRTRVGPSGFVEGAPELAVEIANSSASADLHGKLDSYARAGVPEYLVWRARERAVNWFELRDGAYAALAPDPDGVIRSRVFPGFWLDVNALLARDVPRLLETGRAGLASDACRAFAADLAARLAAHEAGGG